MTPETAALLFAALAAVVAVLSMGLLLAFALIVAVRAGVLWPRWQGASKYLVWGVVGYCGLGVLANALTPSRWERILWLPVVVAMLVCSLIVATNPRSPTGSGLTVTSIRGSRPMPKFLIEVPHEGTAVACVRADIQHMRSMPQTPA